MRPIVVAKGLSETMFCHFLADGTLIPGCMGTAAACGCGKSDEAIMSYCTCRRLTLDELAERIERMECELAELKELARASGFTLSKSENEKE